MKIIYIWSLILLVFCQVVLGSSSFELTPEQIGRFSLTARIPNDAGDLKEQRDQLTKKKAALEWFKSHATPLIKEKFINDALEEIEGQEKELGIWEEMNAATEKVNKVKEPAVEILKGKKDSPSESDIVTVKKWLISCKAEKWCDAPKELLSMQQVVVTNAIEFLQNNPNLREILSEKVKVHRWPQQLTLSHEKEKEKESLVGKIDEIIKKLEEQKENEKNDNLELLIDETKLRKDLVEYFQQREGNVNLTMDELSDRIKSFGFLVAVRFKKLKDRAALTSDDERLVREWLLVHQTVYEVDGVSSGGGFTVDWPGPFPLPEYNLTTETPKENYFPESQGEADTPTNETAPIKSKMFPNLKEKLDKLKPLSTVVMENVTGTVKNLLTGVSGYLLSEKPKEKEKKGWFW